MALGFFTGDNTPDSYEARERKRRLAEAMLLESTSTAPIGSWTQGAARLAQALSGKVQESRINAKDKESGEAYNKLAMSLLGGGSPSPPAPPASAPGPLAAAVGGAPGPLAAAVGGEPTANMPGDMSTWAAAIKKKESAGSGDYAAVGPTHPKLGRALGAYQVMEANIGPWSREALGREVTPDEFMKNPQIQDQVFQHKFGQYVQKFGNPQDAASAWFTGRPLAQGAGARDVLGTTGAAYVQDFNRNIGQQPVQMAQAPGPVASDAPPMAYAGAPAGQAISGASPQPQARPPGQQLAQAVAPTSPPIPQPQPTGNVNAAMYQIMSDPRFSPQQKAQALQMFQMQQRDDGVRPVDLGDKIALMDARGNVRQVLPKSQAPRGPMAIGPDQRLVDPTTGQEIAPPSGGKAPTVQRVKQPDGSEVAVQWDSKGGQDGKGAWVPLNAPQGGNPVASPKLTEAQSKDVGFYNRGEKLIPRLEKQDTALTEFFSRNAANVPIVGNYLKSPEYRQAEQTARELLAVILRKDTGAAVTDREFENYGVMYLPQPGDDPATIKQKQEGRRTAIEGIKMGLGTADVLFKQREALDGSKGQPLPQATSPDGTPKVRKYNPQTGRIE